MAVRAPGSFHLTVYRIGGGVVYHERMVLAAGTARTAYILTPDGHRYEEDVISSISISNSLSRSLPLSLSPCLSAPSLCLCLCPCPCP